LTCARPCWYGPHRLICRIDHSQLGQSGSASAGDGHAPRKAHPARKFLAASFEPNYTEDPPRDHDLLHRATGARSIEQLAAVCQSRAKPSVAISHRVTLCFFAQCRRTARTRSLGCVGLGEDRIVIYHLPWHHATTYPVRSPDRPSVTWPAGLTAKQILGVTGEKPGSLVFSAFAQNHQQLGLRLAQQLGPAGPAHHLGQPLSCRAALIGMPPALAGSAFTGMRSPAGASLSPRLQSNASSMPRYGAQESPRRDLYGTCSGLRNSR